MWLLRPDRPRGNRRSHRYLIGPFALKRDDNSVGTAKWEGSDRSHAMARLIKLAAVVVLLGVLWKVVGGGGGNDEVEIEYEPTE